MELNRALHQISAIHEHLARTEVSREFRAVPVVLTGVIGLLAGMLQERMIPEPDGTSFVLYWSLTAVLAFSVGTAGVLRNYLKQTSEWARRQTRIVTAQMTPSLVAGVLVTLAVAQSAELEATLLPGLWACLFSLGLFAARPYMPHIIGWVALYYLISGAVLLAYHDAGIGFSPWSMALPFGLGQIATGLVFYLDREREKKNGR